MRYRGCSHAVADDFKYGYTLLASHVRPLPSPDRPSVCTDRSHAGSASPHLKRNRSTRELMLATALL